MPYTNSSVIRGNQHRPVEAQAVAQNLEVDDPIRLEPEPENRFDANAVRMMAESEKGSGEFDTHIGYVHRDTAPVIQPWLLNGAEYEASVYQAAGSFSVIGFEFPNSDFDEPHTDDEPSAA